VSKTIRQSASEPTRQQICRCGDVGGGAVDGGESVARRRTIANTNCCSTANSWSSVSFTPEALKNLIPLSSAG